MFLLRKSRDKKHVLLCVDSPPSLVIGVDVSSHNSQEHWSKMGTTKLLANVAMPNASSQVVMMEGVMCLFEFEACVIGHEISGTRFTIKSQEIT